MMPKVSKKKVKAARSSVNYYVMTCEGVDPVRPIGRGPEPPGSWMLGCFVDYVAPGPLVYTLDPDYPGKPKAMYEWDPPVMRKDLIDALSDAGVDNIQYFAAVLRDPKRKREYSNYKAFNIVGLVACADMDASKPKRSNRKSKNDNTEADVHWFDSLVIDEKRVPEGVLMFRLAENISAIIVHKKIKEAIEQAHIPGMVFYGPGEWSG